MSDYLMRALSAVLGAVLAMGAQVTARTAPPAAGPAAPPSPSQVAGRDVSWPNCPKGLGMPSRPTQGKPMPPADAPFVVVGLTNGPAFHPNPCLAEQVSFARTLHLWVSAYAVATYPTAGQLERYGAAGPRPHARRAGRLWNTGWAQATQNVAAMREVGLPSPAVWVDVEPVSLPSPWSDNRSENRLVLAGALAAYRAAGLEVGVYSTPTMWADIAGPARLGLPEWRTAGQDSSGAALAKCRRPDFQGGPAVLTQWYSPREDFDLLCPGRPAAEVLGKYFTRL